ncbi:MAG: PQQ-binding-like beta-propeller repeat protein [Sedimentisphaerales bacterium]|nr:PQQ-binding-like beta-propeller repeat protein [Sedimentisphaerales bacterium]
MLSNRLLLHVIVVVYILSTSLSALGADWPQWGGRNNRNMVSAEKGLPDSFEADKDKAVAGTARNVKWLARLGAYAYGNPTVADGRVFVGTNAQTLSSDPRYDYTRGGLIKCFKEDSGELLWQFGMPERHDLPPGIHFGLQHLGICSSPTVDSDRVYIVGSNAEVLCLDVRGQTNGNDGPFKDEGTYMAGPGKPLIEINEKDGDIIWRFDLIEELGVYPHDAASCSILIVGDMLYLSTSNGVDEPHDKVLAPLAPSLVVLDKRTGELLATDNEKIGTRLWHAQWASPSCGEVGGRMLIFLGGGDGICYAFEALVSAGDEPTHLQKAWSYDCNPPKFRFLDGKEIPYYRGDKRKGSSPNKNDGNYLGPSQIIATPVLYGDRIYIAIGQDPAHGRGKGLLHCIDATKTGDITKNGCIWTYDGLDRSMATAAVADGLVYLVDIGGRLHCLDADTGEQCWVYETNKETWGGPLLADGKLYFGNERNFYIMAAGREAKLISSMRMSAPVHSTAVAANGVVYIASNRYLWATALMK